MKGGKADNIYLQEARVTKVQTHCRGCCIRIRHVSDADMLQTYQKSCRI